MLSVLQNATTTVPSSQFPSLLVFNVNYALLFLVLSGVYMILSDRKVLFSTRIWDLNTPGNIVHYVAIAVVQSAFISIIQTALESWTRLKFVDLGMTVVLFVALLIENWVINQRSSN